MSHSTRENLATFQQYRKSQDPFRHPDHAAASGMHIPFRLVRNIARESFFRPQRDVIAHLPVWLHKDMLAHVILKVVLRDPRVAIGAKFHEQQAPLARPIVNRAPF